MERAVAWCLVLATALAWDDAAASEAAREPRTALEEIVVRARKRDESLEDVPISVTALSEATLRETGVSRLNEIGELVPNLQFLVSSDGQGALVRIRGVGTSTSEIAFDPGVGIYVDGVFMPRALGSIIDTVDVDQVEVLRGPQGTLFGKNTVGGAISIKTVKPGPEVEGFVMVRPGNLSSLDSRAVLNLPAAAGWGRDRLFSRFAIAMRTFGGYVENSRIDQTLSNQSAISFLGSVRLLAGSDITLDASGTWSKDRGAGMGPRCRVANPDAPLLSGIYPGFAAACVRAQPFRFEGDTNQISDVESYGAWTTATWRVGDVGPAEGLVAKSITAWREQRTRLRLELDGTEFPAVQFSSAGGPSALDGSPGRQRQISQEAQLSGHALNGDLEYVAGFFALWETGVDSRTTATGLGVLDFVRNNRNEIDNWTWAPFFQASYRLFDWISLTGGLRYTEDKKGASARVSDPTNPQLPPGLDERDSATFTSWTPMGALALQAPPGWLDEVGVGHLMGYFSYARGFKGGGFNAVLNPAATRLDEFRPETLDSFEVGIKASGWDRSLTLNASAFLGEYNDIQVTAVRDLTTPGDDSPNLVQFTQNAARATTRGAEIEISAVPIPGASVRSSVGLLHTRFDSYPDAIDDNTGGAIDRAGQSFVASPSTQSHVSAQYSFKVDFAGAPGAVGWVTPRLDWYYQSFVHFAGIEVADASQGGYHLLHGRLSYDFFDSRAQVAVWGRNLTDQEYLEFGSATVVSSWGVALQYFGAPRTFGFEISYRL